MTTVLVADDDEGYRYPIVNLLSDSGFKVLEASNQEEIQRQCEGADIWVVDVRLPTMRLEGIQVVRDQLAAGRRPKYVFFCSVIGQASVSEHLQGVKTFNVPVEWLEKPFELELLLSKINHVVGGRA